MSTYINYTVCGNKINHYLINKKNTIRIQDFTDQFKLFVFQNKYHNQKHVAVNIFDEYLDHPIFINKKIESMRKNK